VVLVDDISKLAVIVVPLVIVFDVLIYPTWLALLLPTMVSDVDVPSARLRLLIVRLLKSVLETLLEIASAVCVLYVLKSLDSTLLDISLAVVA